MTAIVNPSAKQKIDEAGREALRRDPAVRVRRRKVAGSFVSPIRLVRPVDLREIMGRCEADDEPERAKE